MPKDPRLKPIHPGEILREELLIPLDMSEEDFAQELELDKKIITEIISERRGIDFKIALKLSSRFSPSAQFWLNLQRSYERDLMKKKKTLEVRYEKVGERELKPSQKYYSKIL